MPHPAYSAPERFAVSAAGMRALHADRPPWTLIKELIQNSWDEAPHATECRVSLTPAAGGGVLVVVTDDGPGFADIKDAWTLMGDTAKRSDPRKRGRFNLGEKEIISAARAATVETVGYTVDFPPLGGRFVSSNDRAAGVRVTCEMEWHPDVIPDIVAQLRRLRPRECRLYVNGDAVPQYAPLRTVAATLDTVLQDAPGQPLRPTRRKTEIQILERRDAAAGWLYEMGIPIQPAQCPYDLDVMQKVPMPPNRDTVSAGYLQALYAETLNAVHQLLENEEFGADWVKNAIGSRRVTPPTVAAVVKGRYGDKAALTSNSADANMHAAEAGYELVNPRSLSPAEREKFREFAKMPSARELFPQPQPSLTAVSIIIPRDEHQEFIEWAESTAALANLNAAVVVIEEPKSGRLADCTANTANPTVRFNRATLPQAFFDPPFGREEHLDILFHELGHALANTPMAHGPGWGYGVAKVAARITCALTSQASAHADAA